uniref:Uncharacterized protein n=1 Tax=Tanacetum cinerariifolium TaxID=118510 RepID=A0A699HY91_TANCI|nr:hypothetical protein [Tanacetum cinerariifolium]
MVVVECCVKAFGEKGRGPRGSISESFRVRQDWPLKVYGFIAWPITSGVMIAGRREVVGSGKNGRKCGKVGVTGMARKGEGVNSTLNRCMTGVSVCAIYIVSPWGLRGLSLKVLPGL